MTDCNNDNCHKKKLIDGFPVLKEGKWEMKSNVIILGTNGKTVNFSYRIFLNLISAKITLWIK